MASSNPKEEQAPLLGGGRDGTKRTTVEETTFPLGGSYRTVVGAEGSYNRSSQISPHHRRSITETTNIIEDSFGNLRERPSAADTESTNIIDSFKRPWERPTPHRWKASGFSLVMLLIVTTYSIIIFIVPLILFIRKKSSWCPYADDDHEGRDQSYLLENKNSPYENPDYNLEPCRFLRMPCLLGLTLEDCDISRRMMVAVMLGAVIGYERRAADRPAGVRTMSLVSLGSAFFTISSIMCFKSSTMGWDASRVTAALPSGVGFLGGALIWKGSIYVEELGTEKHQVHGLTTAASLWLSAALGVGAGGALYAVSMYATCLVLFLLRHGPALHEFDDDHEEEKKVLDDDLDDLAAIAGILKNNRPLTEGSILARNEVLNLGGDAARLFPEDEGFRTDIERLRSSIRLRRLRRGRSKKGLPTFGS